MFRIGSALLVLVVAAGPVVAASPDPKSLAIPADELSKSRALVRQLGSEEFEEREEAEEALVKMGRVARPALLEGVNTNPNAEVRARCATLLPHATILEMKARLDVFLADTEGKYEHNFPGWNQFRAAVCNDWTMLGYRVWSDRVLQKGARSVFVELISTQVNRTVVMATGRSQSDLVQIATARRMELHPLKGPRAGGFRPGGFASERTAPYDPTAEDVAALLFAESLSQSKGIVVARRPVSISTLLSSSGFTLKARDTDDKGKVYRAIAVAWLESRSVPIEMMQAVSIARDLDLPEQAMRLAARLLTTPGTTTPARLTAAATLTHLGGKEHLPLLEKALEDAEALLIIPENVPGAPANELQVRDVALGIAIQVTGQQPEDYGFVDRFSMRGNPVQTPYFMHYLPTDKRKAAFDKWNTWRAENEKK